METTLGGGRERGRVRRGALSTQSLAQLAREQHPPYGTGCWGCKSGEQHGGPMAGGQPCTSDTVPHPRTSALAWARCTQASSRGSGGARGRTAGTDTGQRSVCRRGAGAVVQIPALQQWEEGRVTPASGAPFLGQKTPVPHSMVLPNGLGGLENRSRGLF